MSNYKEYLKSHHYRIICYAHQNIEQRSEEVDLVLNSMSKEKQILFEMACFHITKNLMVFINNNNYYYLCDPSDWFHQQGQYVRYALLRIVG